MKPSVFLLVASALAYAEARFAPGNIADEINFPGKSTEGDDDKIVTTPEKAPNAIDPNSGDKPPFFLLVGDSTVASNTGWGDGLLELTSHPDNGINWGKGGATTVSYREEGLWDQVIDNTTAFKIDHEPIVTIQFGHNDHKLDSGISLHGFEENLKNMALEVKKAGGTPILVTPLAVRVFEKDVPVDSLAQQREKVIAAATAAGVDHIDLNTASRDYVQKVGKKGTASYDLNSNDQVHLNPTGRTVFARMVADLLVKARPDLEKSLEPKDEVSEKIAAGEVVTIDGQSQEQPQQEEQKEQPQQEEQNGQVQQEEQNGQVEQEKQNGQVEQEEEQNGQMQQEEQNGQMQQEEQKEQLQ
ncbi:SGNH hydrolase-type esterase domain-containing protein [Aspergillus taichungensis]|uniref:SGNH hydrolase-type esterase domain-containing protein n=1 Tax=Aspergillus taichungensis TaxID=482145 RepID=A0A2J5I941_9EURO|nr:SGNH hydrolase-type esterase domain-containing protein [Aspergillus taichungensis]